VGWGEGGREGGRGAENEMKGLSGDATMLMVSALFAPVRRMKK
jgi:hypothetical protein